MNKIYNNASSKDVSAYVIYAKKHLSQMYLPYYDKELTRPMSAEDLRKLVINNGLIVYEGDDGVLYAKVLSWKVLDEARKCFACCFSESIKSNAALISHETVDSGIFKTG